MKTRKMFALIVVFVFCMMPLTTYAASSKIYSDVSTKTVDKQSYAAVAYVKKYNGWKGLIKKNKLYPNKAITRGEFLRILYNLYGKKVYADIGDVVNYNVVATSSFCCGRMVKLSKALGYGIKWAGYKSKMKRKDAARYIKIFATFNKKLAPHK